jgi:hypothetical protein
MHEPGASECGGGQSPRYPWNDDFGGFTILDDSGGSGGENQPPVALSDSGGIATLGRVFHHPSQQTPNILDNDYDPDPNDTVSFSRVLQGPQYGTITMGPTPGGSFEYTPRMIGHPPVPLETRRASKGPDGAA